MVVTNFQQLERKKKSSNNFLAPTNWHQREMPPTSPLAPTRSCLERARGYGLKREREGEAIGTVRVAARKGGSEMIREIMLGSFI